MFLWSMKITCKTAPVEVGNSQRDLHYSKIDEQSCAPLPAQCLPGSSTLLSKRRKNSDIHAVKDRASERQDGLKIQVCPSLAVIWDKTPKIPEPPRYRDTVTYPKGLMESIISFIPSSLRKPPGNLGLSQGGCRITE